MTKFNITLVSATKTEGHTYVYADRFEVAPNGSLCFYSNNKIFHAIAPNRWSRVWED